MATARGGKCERLSPVNIHVGFSALRRFLCGCLQARKAEEAMARLKAEVSAQSGRIESKNVLRPWSVCV